MKKYISTLVLLLIANFCSSQTYSWISSYYYSYTEISIEFQRTTPVKGGFSYQNALSTMQSQYDAAWEEVNLVYNIIIIKR
jgi:hypothetical protein